LNPTTRGQLIHLVVEYGSEAITIRTPDTGAYKIVEDIRDYSQLGGLENKQDRLQQQFYMFNAFMANGKRVKFY
jgi:hypothetical protein